MELLLFIYIKKVIVLFNGIRSFMIYISIDISAEMLICYPSVTGSTDYTKFTRLQIIIVLRVYE